MPTGSTCERISLTGDAEIVNQHEREAYSLKLHITKTITLYNVWGTPRPNFHTEPPFHTPVRVSGKYVYWQRIGERRYILLSPIMLSHISVSPRCIVLLPIRSRLIRACNWIALIMSLISESHWSSLNDYQDVDTAVKRASIMLLSLPLCEKFVTEFATHWPPFIS